jgi:hypothetical protein
MSSENSFAGLPNCPGSCEWHTSHESLAGAAGVTDTLARHQRMMAAPIAQRLIRELLIEGLFIFRIAKAALLLLGLEDRQARQHDDVSQRENPEAGEEPRNASKTRLVVKERHDHPDSSCNAEQHQAEKLAVNKEDL